MSAPIQPVAYLTPITPGRSGQPSQSVRRQVLPGPVGDVVDDQRYGAGGGESGETGEHSRLAGTHERRHHAQRRHYLGPVPQRLRSLHGAGADQQLRGAFPAES
jgi:hypothetical protein